MNWRDKTRPHDSNRKSVPDSGNRFSLPIKPLKGLYFFANFSCQHHMWYYHPKRSPLIGEFPASQQVWDFQKIKRILSFFRHCINGKKLIEQE
jgi:hypothetical protein